MKIAAFNIQRLGRTKVNKEDVREIIIKVTHRAEPHKFVRCNISVNVFIHGEKIKGKEQFFMH